MAKVRATRPAREYIALRAVENKDGRRWEAGAAVRDGDFPQSVIAAWLESGVLSESAPPASVKARAGGDEESNNGDG